MITKISLLDADGKSVSGRFEVSRGMITVTASDGRTKTVEIDESMLSPETLARMLLLQLHQAGRTAERPWHSVPCIDDCASVH
jgi:DNA-binding protein YbaB